MNNTKSQLIRSLELAEKNVTLAWSKVRSERGAAFTSALKEYDHAQMARQSAKDELLKFTKSTACEHCMRDGAKLRNSGHTVCDKCANASRVSDR